MTVPGMGGLAPKPLNAPPGVPLPVGVQAGASSAVVVANRVIIIGEAGEVLIYNGTPGPGTLAVAITGSAGADQYGNEWAGDISVGLNTQYPLYITENGSQAQIQFVAPGGYKDALIFMVEGSGVASLGIEGPASTVAGENDVAVVNIDSNNGSSSAGMNFTYSDADGGGHSMISYNCGGVAMPTTGIITGVLPGTGQSPTNPAVPETWHTVDYAGSWGPAAAGNDLQYQQLPLGEGDVVFLTGRLEVPSSPGNPSTISTITNDAYWPAHDQPIVCEAHGGSPYTGIPCVLVITPAGVLEVYGPLVAGDTLEIQGFYRLG